MKNIEDFYQKLDSVPSISLEEFKFFFQEDTSAFTSVFEWVNLFLLGLETGVFSFIFFFGFIISLFFLCVAIFSFFKEKEVKVKVSMALMIFSIIFCLPLLAKFSYQLDLKNRFQELLIVKNLSYSEIEEKEIAQEKIHNYFYERQKLASYFYRDNFKMNGESYGYLEDKVIHYCFKNNKLSIFERFDIIKKCVKQELDKVLITGKRYD